MDRRPRVAAAETAQGSDWGQATVVSRVINLNRVFGKVLSLI